MVELAAPELPSFAGAVLGIVSRAPSGLGQPFEVLVPTFSSEHAYTIRRWQSRGVTVPAVDDEVLVVEDQNRLPWVVAWWPAAGDTPVASSAQLEAARAELRPTLILARAATTAVLPTNTLTGITLEASANAALAAQDGVSLAVGDRLLVKNEATGSKNGVYEVTSLGSASTKWVLTRISTMNESAEVVPGMQVRAAQGTQNGGVTFSLLTTGAITLGTTALTFGYASEWTGVTLAGTWENFEAAGSNPVAAYRKDSRNFVTLRGLIKHTVSIAALTASLMFTLPEGFRPSKIDRFTSHTVNGALILAEITVSTNGDVAISQQTAGAVGFTALNVINFYAD